MLQARVPAGSHRDRRDLLADDIHTRSGNCRSGCLRTRRAGIGGPKISATDDRTSVSAHRTRSGVTAPCVARRIERTGSRPAASPPSWTCRICRTCLSLEPPKCGTTGICSYLRQHPDIFVPAKRASLLWHRPRISKKKSWPTAETFAGRYAHPGHVKYRADCAIWYLTRVAQRPKLPPASPGAKCNRTTPEAVRNGLRAPQRISL